ncbi:MAG: hypothetical protein FWD25_07145 [Clostridia bacterium]|nr:hypothetical protein [Clostridia bacterium]
MKSYQYALLIAVTVFTLSFVSLSYALTTDIGPVSNLDVDTSPIYEQFSVSAIQFPDPRFEAEVRSIIEKPIGVITANDVAKITELYVSELGIEDLTGIEYFTALEILDCAWNNLTKLDLSSNAKLRKLECTGNRLMMLNISQNTMLTDLSVFSNELTLLDISQNTMLAWLSCGYNQLTTLDASQNTKLEELYCSGNALKSLYLGENVVLRGLECDSNKLTTLDVSQNIGLEWLECSENQLKALDISKNIKLAYLGCFNNHFPNKSAIIGLDEERLVYGFVFDPLGV